MDGKQVTTLTEKSHVIGKSFSFKSLGVCDFNHAARLYGNNPVFFQGGKGIGNSDPVCAGQIGKILVGKMYFFFAVLLGEKAV